MTNQLHGHLDPSTDRVRNKRPVDPRVREAHNVWIFDDLGRFAFPRIGVEAVAVAWETRGIQANVSFPDGRVLNGAGAAAATTDVRGRHTFGAGPIVFERLEPFSTWAMTWDGEMRETSVREQLTGLVAKGRVPVQIDVEMSMCVPPWVQGKMSEAAAAALGDPLEGGFMGGERFEQLFRCAGRLRTGVDVWDFTGTGLRIQRHGVRDTTEFWGHNWQSALFPSGRAFGLICYPPRPDGTPSYAEAYVYDDARLHPGEIVDVRWLTAIEPSGGDVSVSLRTEAHGEFTIDGTTHAPTYSPQGGSLFLDWTIGDVRPRNPVTFEQSGATYSWDGETAYGMSERSLFDHQISRPR